MQLRMIYHWVTSTQIIYTEGKSYFKSVFLQKQLETTVILYFPFSTAIIWHSLQLKIFACDSRTFQIIWNTEIFCPSCYWIFTLGNPWLRSIQTILFSFMCIWKLTILREGWLESGKRDQCINLRPYFALTPCISPPFLSPPS